MEEFLKIIHFLKTNSCQKIGIFVHKNADPDAIASAIGLKDLLMRLLENIKIRLYASSLNTLSLNILEKSEEEFFYSIEEQKLEAIFLCDTNNLLQLGDLDLEKHVSKGVPVFIIDHHSEHEFIKETEKAIVKPFTSTAEIISKIYQNLELKPKREIATILIAGIIFDTKRFIFLSKHTFPVMQFLLDSGGDYKEALANLRFKKSLSEKIARLKGAQRVLISRDKEFILAITQVNSFESSVARSLINLGADIVAVLAKPSKQEYRLSLRCTIKYAEERDVHLGDLANTISIKIGGSGGGHQTAAGMNFTNVDLFPKTKTECLQFVEEILLENIIQSQNKQDG